MRKSILIFTLLFATIGGAGLKAMAAPALEVVESDMQSISVGLVGESVLHVTGAAGMVLSIYNVTGVKVMSFRVEGSDKSYNLNLPKGCYIVKVGKVVRKISVR